MILVEVKFEVNTFKYIAERHDTKCLAFRSTYNA